MEKQILLDLVNKNYSINDIAIELNKSKTSIRHWLGKYQLKTIRAIRKVEHISRVCPCCKVEKDVSKFYSRRDKTGNSTYCKECSNTQAIIRQKDLKQKCLDYKGNKCIVCNYNNYSGALEFHHIDPSQKDFTISHLKSYSFNDLVKNELDKCALLCANCHREVHANLIDLNQYIQLS